LKRCANRRAEILARVYLPRHTVPGVSHFLFDHPYILSTSVLSLQGCLSHRMLITGLAGIGR